MPPSEGYRYPGARPFADTSLDRKLFCGREQEGNYLLHMILSERLVVLYGRSGVGKSSLISAGTLQRLRSDGYGPVRIRFNDVRKGSIAPVFDGVAQAAADESWECIPGERASLSRFFQGLELWRGDELITPLLVLDQFEELFTIHSAAERQRFIKEFAVLVRGADVRDVDAGDAAALPAVKILISLREDFLPELEEMAPLVPHILQNRFRLEPLSPRHAREAITKPASERDPQISTLPFTFTDRAVDEIVAFLASQETPTRIQRDEVEPFQLQIICQHTEALVRIRQLAGERDVTIDRDLGGVAGLRRVLGRFYETQINALQPPTLRHKVFRLCETGLINPEGRRLTLEEGDITRRFGVPRSALLDLENRRVLRTDPRRGMAYYELSHDSLIAPVREAAGARRRLRLRRRIALATAVGVIVAALGGRAVYRSVLSNSLEQQARALPDLARQDGTVALARAVTLAARAFNQFGVSATIGESLVTTERNITAVETGSLPPADGPIVLSPRGSAVFVASGDGRVQAFDTRGAPIQSVNGAAGRPIIDMAIGPLSDRLAFVQDEAHGDVVRLWSGIADATTRIAAPFSVAKVAFSPDETRLALLGEQGELALVDVERGRIDADIRRADPPGGRLDARAVLAFRQDGRWLAVSEPAAAAGQSTDQVRLWYAGAATADLRPTTSLVSGALLHPTWSATPDDAVFVQSSGLLAIVRRRDVQHPTIVPPIERDARNLGPDGDTDRLVSAVAVSADGTVVAVGHRDGYIRTFELSHNTEGTTLRATFRASTSPIMQVALSPDGKLVGTVSDEPNGAIWTNDGLSRGKFEVLTDAGQRRNDWRIHSMLFHPDARCGLVLTGDTDGSVRFWNVPADSSRRATGAGGGGSGSLTTGVTSNPIEVGTGIERRRNPVGYVLSMASTRDSTGHDQLIVGDDEGRLELWTATANPCSEAGAVQRSSWRLTVPVALKASADIDGLSIHASGAQVVARMNIEDVGVEPTLWSTPQLTLLNPTDFADRLGEIEDQQLKAQLDEARLRYREMSRYGYGNAMVGDMEATLRQLEARAASVSRVKARRRIAGKQPPAPTSPRPLAHDTRATAASVLGIVSPQLTAASFTETGSELLVGDQFGNWTRLTLELEPPAEIAAGFYASANGQTAGTRGIVIARTPSQSGAVVHYGSGVPAVSAWSLSPAAESLTTVDATGSIWDDGSVVNVSLPDGDTVGAAAFHSQGRTALVLLSRRDRRLFDVAVSRPNEPSLTAVDTRLLVPAKVLVSTMRGRKLVDPGGRYILSYLDESLVQYDPRDGHMLDWRSGHEGCTSMTSATLGFNGRILVGCAGGKILTFQNGFFDEIEGERLHADDGDTSIVSVAASAAGAWIAGGTDRGDVLLWSDGRPTRIRDAHVGSVVALAFSPDQRLLATGGRSETSQPSIKIWDVGGEPRLAYELRGHLSGAINYLEFSPDGRRLVSAGDDGTAQIWDLAARQAPLHLLRHGSRVLTASFVRDGIVSQTLPDDGTSQFSLWNASGARVWQEADRLPDVDAPWQSWLDAACRRLGGAVERSGQDATALTEAAAACRAFVGSRDGVSLPLAAASLGDLDYVKGAMSTRGRLETDGEGRTALHRAAREGHAAVVAYLAGAGANLDARDKGGQTALQTALARQHANVAALLIRSGAGATVSDALGNTALHIAALTGDAAAVHGMLTRGTPANVTNALGVTPLMNAARALNLQILEELLRRGAAVNAVDHFGSTALMDAARSSGSSTVAADIIARLLSAGADVDAQTSGGRPRNRRTALLWAKAANARLTSVVDPRAVELLRGKSPLVTDAPPQITVRFPLSLYLPGTLKPMAAQLEPWTDVGMAGPGAQRTLDALVTHAETDAFCMFLVGRAYEVGIGTDRDHLRAQHWYERSADAQEPLGKIGLAMLLWNALPGIRQDMPRVERLLRELNNAQHPLGQTYYATFLRDVANDASQARSVLQRAAEAPVGDPVAQNAWALVLAGENDIDGAIAWFRRAADQNDVFGLINIADQVKDGRVPGSTPADALGWYQRPQAMASQGALAQYEIGRMYESGIGIPASTAEALKWYRLAVELGNPDAPRRLAWTLEAADSAKAGDRVELIRSYYRASVNGDILAARKLLALGFKP